MKKPDTVPDRIWTLWLEHRETNALWDICSDVPERIRRRPATERAVLDRECASVWAALDRRYDEFAVRFIFDLIQESFEGPTGGCALLPRAERRRHGKKIARLACELAEELAVVRRLSAESWAFEGPAPLPTEIANEINRTPLAATQLTLTRKDEEVYVPGHRWVPSEEIVNLVLSHLETGAKQWADSTPPVDDRSTNPLRLHFIRSMSLAFFKCFETPMREQVAALSGCLFGTPTDASTVAKLAPLNNDTLPWGLCSMEEPET